MDQVKYHRDRDNTFYINFYRNNTRLTPIEMAAITKFEFKYLGAYYNSDVYPAVFSRDNANGRVKILLKTLDLELSKDLVEVIIYDAADNISGLYWDTFELTVLGNVLIPTTTPPTTVTPTTTP